MAQTEDTELRDLVIEALEKNGSLAKIRALLRANIFLAFEDDCENIKQNDCLDKILKLPEGVLSLSIIHEFLEFCNLKNTLFVYMSETRQGKEYTYRGHQNITEMLHLHSFNSEKEPLLVTILRYFLKSQKSIKDNNSHNSFDHAEHSTYIVNQDSSSTSTSQSQSDNSSDEKNKLDLRLPLDNSDTDTSSDSIRNKNSSEYVPNQHIVLSNVEKNKAVTEEIVTNTLPGNKEQKTFIENNSPKLTTSNTESTSYAELKPFSSHDEKLINTTGIPHAELSDNKTKDHSPLSHESQSDTIHTHSSTTSHSAKQEVNDTGTAKKSLEQSIKYDTPEYSYDFSSPVFSAEQNKEIKKHTKSDNIESPGSQSSISISDVADLISDKSFGQNNSVAQRNMKTDKSKSPENYSIKSSNNSGDFSDSPIPSISNLSLDFHSD